MITAVDTAALIAIVQGEADAEAWVNVLARARSHGALWIGEVVAAEFYAVVLDEEVFRSSLSDLGIGFVQSSRRAACRAGEIFRAYRNEGGPRHNLIPDFLIAAQAEIDCDQLATRDRGYLRRYFPRLTLVAP